MTATKVSFAGEELGQQAVLKLSQMMKLAFGVFPSFGHQEVGIGVEINFLSERLDDGYSPGTKLRAGSGLEVFEERPDGRPAMLAVAALTVGMHTLRAARANPVDSLRYE